MTWATTPLAQAEQAQDHEAGRRIYNFRCYYCHGYSGDARTLASTYLDPKPRDFTSLRPDAPDRKSMVRTVSSGRAGTAMQGYGNVLSKPEIEAVVAFIRAEFVEAHAPNTRYHSPDNGWPDHEKYAVAYPFARGDIALDLAPEHLDADQRAGRRMYMSSCISCHDHGLAAHRPTASAWAKGRAAGSTNELKPAGSVPGKVVHVSLATSVTASPKRPSVKQRPKQTSIQSNCPVCHGQDGPGKPALARLTAEERRGEKLFQSNCAFCHAPDGGGRNWLASFLETRPRDLTGQAIAGITVERLAEVVRNGLPETSMPAWRSVLNDRDIQAVAAYVYKAFRAGYTDSEPIKPQRPCLGESSICATCAC